MRHFYCVLSLHNKTFLKIQIGVFMSFKQGLLVTVLAGSLIACGGGGDGYFSESNNNNTPTIPNTDLTEAQLSLDVLKREGQFLFGNYDPNDANTSKGYIDHALDTFAQGPLQLSMAIRKVNLNDYKNKRYYRDKCFSLSETDYRSCYIFVGEDIKNIIPNYDDWDFDITSNDLKNIKLQHDDISPNLPSYESTTRVYVFENENGDKNFNDVTITGAFAYPFQQSWNIVQSKQKRFVLINESTSEYKITTTIQQFDQESGGMVDKEITTGAISIYKDLTSRDGDLYNIQSGSGFNVLINDNANIPFAEPIAFVLDSTPGTQASASYRIKPDGLQELILPNITSIEGDRIENESPNQNKQIFTGSIHLLGKNIFKFKQELSGNLQFEHRLNNMTFKGISTNNNGTISTNLTFPNNLKF